MQIPKTLHDYALFCAMNPSTDVLNQGFLYAVVCGEISHDDLSQMDKTFVLCDDEGGVIIVAEKEDVEKAKVENYPNAIMMSGREYIQTYRQKIMSQFR